jgi:Tfp pilus assembly protein PilF
VGAGVSEETEGQDTGAEAVAGGADAAAVALALNGASQKTADAFLNDQRALIADQRHHLHEQFKQLRLGIWEKRLGVLLRMATAMIGLAVAAGLAFLVWAAAHSNGLLIEPFSVPPELAAKGLTSEVVATKVLDRLMLMQSLTSSQRAPRSYANSWDEKGIKLDVPETGVSLGELDAFLHQELGNDTHVSGEVVRTASGVSLTARAGVNVADSVAGPEEDMDALVQRLAESVYRMTQPYRYSVYLASHGRMADAIPVLTPLAKSGSVEDRPWAYNVLALDALDREGVQPALGLMRKAVKVDPKFVVSQVNIARFEYQQGRPEQSMGAARSILPMLSGEAEQIILPRFIPAIRKMAEFQIDMPSGAFHDAAEDQDFVIKSGIPGRWGLSDDLARSQGDEHDLAAARATLADPAPDSGLVPGESVLGKALAMMVIESEAQDWTGVLTQDKELETALAPFAGEQSFLPTLIAPLTAIAQARLGRFDAADAAIALSPADCYECLITRALIAEMKGDSARANWWFARAADAAPSIPFAYTDWGQALLARGQPDAAIEKFTLANQKGPHFADPLQGWGEALMAKNQSHLALAKFQEANKYAPNWGRLHLKWGEALTFAGKADEAKAQFARAATLDLTPSEKAELAGMVRG